MCLEKLGAIWRMVKLTENRKPSVRCTKYSFPGNFFRSHKQKRKNLVRTRGMESSERKTQKTVPRGAKTYKKQCPQSELIELCSKPGSARRVFFLLLLVFFYYSCCLTVVVRVCVFFKVTDMFPLCEGCAGRPSR